MTAEKYKLIEGYMKECMHDSAHDEEHIYRVLYVALDIASTEVAADLDIIIAAAFLHDIGRKDQLENPELCHAQIGAEKAYLFLKSKGFDEDFAEKVRECINAHRFRGDNKPETLEAKILFDADKIDVTGAIGIARTLMYNGSKGEPLYRTSQNGEPSDGTDDTEPSFFQEYKFKLEKLYTRLYTRRGKEIAVERKKNAVNFYESILSEVKSSYALGNSIITKYSV